MSYSAGITTQALVGFVVCIVIFFALLPIHPSKFRNLVLSAACGVAVVFFGLFGWAISDNDGSVGSSLTVDLNLEFSALAFIMLYGISTSTGSATAYATHISDWTRFSRTRTTPTIPLLLGAPLFGPLTSIIGILATSAVHSKNGVIEWNPLALLLWLQRNK
jgi:NCS1 family nucleobase:cation symporter-1